MATKTLNDLNADELEIIIQYLDTDSCISLIRSSKVIYMKLNGSPGFWKHLCENEWFDEYNALR